MNKENGKPENIDEYIAGFSKDVQGILNSLRAAIRKAAPEAEEVISYQMPAFKLNGNLVYFAAYKNHIGFYPTSSGIKAFEKDLSGYKGARGSVQFPIDGPLPLALIGRIVKYRVQENLKKAAPKKEGFLSSLSAPARRALERQGIATPRQLTRYSEKEILALHGIGPGSIPRLRTLLRTEGLSFRKDDPNEG